MMRRSRTRLSSSRTAAGIKLRVLAMLFVPSVPGAAIASQPAEPVANGVSDAARRADDEGERLFAAGRHAESLPYFVESLAINERELGAEHPATLVSVNDVAVVHFMLGNLDRAEPLFLRALEARERTLGPEHPDTLTTVRGLGMVLATRGHFDRAESLLVRAAQIRERILGAEHSDTLVALSSLANLRYGQGRHDEAEGLFVRILEVQRRALGDEHVNTLNTVASLGEVYRVRGRFAEAITLLTTGLANAERALGQEHAQTIQIANNLGAVYVATGSYSEAEPIFVHALEVLERTFAPDHVQVVTAVNNLAEVYRLRGQCGRAEPLMLRAHETRQRTGGPEHPDSLLSEQNLAVIYGCQGRYDEADRLLRHARETSARVLGADHPSTLRTLDNLGQLEQLRGRLDQAEQTFLAAYRLKERALGPTHFDTLITASNLAHLYGVQGRFDEAEPLHLRVLEARERILGREHPDTLASIGNLAALYRLQSRLGEAATLYVRALTAYQRLLGPEHPMTLSVMTGLGQTYSYLNLFDQAQPLLATALEIKERTLGKEHPDTLYSISELAELYRAQQRFAEAEPLYGRLVETSLRVLGSDHPHTLIYLGNAAFFYRTLGRYPAETDQIFSHVVDSSLRLLGPENLDTLAIAITLTLSRLASHNSASAIEPARVVLAGARARRASQFGSRFARAQHAREEPFAAAWFGLFADAAWAAGRGRPDDGPLELEVFAALQDSLAGPASRSIAQMAVRRYAGRRGPDLDALLREREQLLAEWDAQLQALSENLTAPESVDPARRERIQRERARIEARMEEIDDRLRVEFPDFLSLARPDAIPLADVQALLRPDEALLLLVPSHHGTHAFAVSRERTGWHRSELRPAAILAAVQRLRWDAGASVDASADQIAAWEQQVAALGGGSSFDRNTAFRLHHELIEPLAGVIEGKRTLYVAAGGALAGLPLSVLVTALPQGDDNDPDSLRRTAWLSDRFALVQIPSVQSLMLLRRAAEQGPVTREGFIGIGDPVLEGEARSRSARQAGGEAPDAARLFVARASGDDAPRANVNALRLLARLPGTAVELRAMRDALGASGRSLLLAEQATEPAIRRADAANRLYRARVLAFATHGLIAGEIEDLAEPGLVLTPPTEASEDNDGYLAASEIVTLHLNADWVILSACNTATGDGAQSQGLGALARAFFYAGARNLLASHWPVSDEVAPIMTVRTIQLERNGTPRAEALQQAMREIRMDTRHDNSTDSWAHPFYWAPFVLIGDGGPR